MRVYNRRKRTIPRKIRSSFSVFDLYCAAEVLRKHLVNVNYKLRVLGNYILQVF